MNLKALCIALVAVVLPMASVAQTDAAFEQKIENYLKTEKGQQAIGKAAEQYFRNLEMQARKQEGQAQAQQLEEQFKNPVNVEIGDSYVKGPKDAKVTIVEFSDFQCPFCKRGKETMDQLLKMYPNDVKLVFKNLPLDFHPQAKPASKAALAAGKQGKFWEMHDALFENQRELGDALYEKKAKELGLNVEQFKKDMASPAVDKQVEVEKAQAEKLGIRGTPGFFVNGVAVRGAYPVEHFKKIIDRWLAKK